MKRIRTGDEVIVVSGRSKGQRGRVRSINGDRCIVGGVNMVKKHRKPAPAQNITGGIVDIEASLHMSNVALYDEKSEKPSRIGIRVEDGVKVRFYKRSNERVAEPEKD